MSWWSLLGSGEFQPWSEPVDRRLLEEADGDGRVLDVEARTATHKNHGIFFGVW